MQIDFNSNINMIQFKGRRIKYTNEQLSEILEPLFEQRKPYNKIMASTGLSHDVINEWSKAVKGMSANKLYRRSIVRDWRDQSFRKEMQGYRDAGYSAYRLSIIYKHSVMWVYNMLRKLNMIIIKPKEPTQLQVKMQENIPRMIKEGYTIEAMAKELGCGHTSVSNWIFDTYKKSILQIRQENNIKIAIR